MIVWREKLLATAVHFGATLVLAAAAAALIFLVWYPDPFQTMVGGTELFVLVVGCDLALGPLMSLVVYDSRKTRRALLVDYTVVGLIQIAALVYGVIIVAGSRPAYIAYSTDRFEVVSARDIADAELAAAKDPQYASLPWTGPRYVSIEVPEPDKEDALFQSLAGNEEHQRPKFYRPFEAQIDSMRKRARPLDSLRQDKPASVPLLDQALRGVDRPANELAWLPVHYNKGFWTAIVDTATFRPVAYVDFDPY
jgi:hypothetical protein